MRFSTTEQLDLLKAWATITLAFAIVLGGLNFAQPMLLINAAVTVGLGFLLHELAHKFVAQYYGMWAEFRADDKFLMIAIVTAFMGFIFAAPGAVIISGYGNLKQYGKIALAGPIVNIVLAGIFYMGIQIFPQLGLPLGALTLFSYGYHINSWLAFFNLIPFGPLDGLKVKTWNPTIWLAFFVFTGFLTFVVSP